MLDASGSVNDEEWDQMIEGVSNTVASLNLSSNIRYCVTQFSGSSSYNISIPFTSDPTMVNSMGRDYSGGTDVKAAFDKVVSGINDGTLGHNVNDILKVVLYTDANVNDFKVPDWNVYNTIKESPISADVTVVRYQSGNSYWDPLANAIAAAIASKGGEYNDDIAINSNDPQGSGGPRKLYITNFENTELDIVPSILNCTQSSVIIPTFCDDPYIVWSSSEGGMIIGDSIGVTTIETNGIGTYSVTVRCGVNGECMLTDETGGNSNNNGQNVQLFESRAEFVDGKLVWPHQRENTDVLETSDELIDQILELYPNPANDKLTLSLPIGKFKITAYDTFGRSIFDQKVNCTSGFFDIETSKWNEGVAIVKVQNIEGGSIVASSKVTIIH